MSKGSPEQSAITSLRGAEKESWRAAGLDRNFATLTDTFGVKGTQTSGRVEKELPKVRTVEDILKEAQNRSLEVSGLGSNFIK